jgi:hypothetical protein
MVTCDFIRNFVSWYNLPRVEAGKNTSTVIPASRKRRRKWNRISLRWDSANRPKRRLMRTYFWISLFMPYRITANYLIESNVILIANKELKNCTIHFVEYRGDICVLLKLCPCQLRFVWVITVQDSIDGLIKLRRVPFVKLGRTSIPRRHPLVEIWFRKCIKLSFLSIWSSEIIYKAP